jgi:hypothetical protein
VGFWAQARIIIGAAQHPAMRQILMLMKQSVKQIVQKTTRRTTARLTVLKYMMYQGVCNLVGFHARVSCVYTGIFVRLLK